MLPRPVSKREAIVLEHHPRRWLPFRDRPALLDRERELAAAITEIDAEQRRLTARYVELRQELIEVHRLLWPPDRGGDYRKNRRPDVPGPSVVPPPAPGAQPLWGRPLRRAVLASLRKAGGPLTVSQIHRSLHLSGYCLRSEQPVKQLGDALRYEELQGRVRRVARGTYAAAP